jgi:F-type H+-transporting ATPase subunit b
VEALGINFGFFLAQVLNFLLIFSILTAVLWRPLISVMEKRKETIEKGLEDARIASEARANAEKDAEAIRNEARSEAQHIVAEAHARAEETNKDIVAEAQKAAEAIRTAARTHTDDERNQLLADMRDQVISLAIAAANHLIGESMDTNKQEEIVNQFFSNVPDKVENLGDEIEVISALPLTDAEKNKIKDVTGASKIEYKVNPDLLGGLVLRAGNRMVDGSVRSNLNALRSELS